MRKTNLWKKTNTLPNSVGKNQPEPRRKFSQPVRLSRAKKEKIIDSENIYTAADEQLRLICSVAEKNIVKMDEMDEHSIAKSPKYASAAAVIFFFLFPLSIFQEIGINVI